MQEATFQPEEMKYAHKFHIVFMIFSFPPLFSFFLSRFYIFLYLRGAVDFVIILYFSYFFLFVVSFS